MTNPTPVAWMYSDDNRGGTGVISFDRISHYKNEVAMFTEDQLNQARADALREAAEDFEFLHVVDSKFIASKLRRMAEEMNRE